MVASVTRSTAAPATTASTRLHHAEHTNCDSPPHGIAPLQRVNAVSAPRRRQREAMRVSNRFVSPWEVNFDYALRSRPLLPSLSPSLSPPELVGAALGAGVGTGLGAAA